MIISKEVISYRCSECGSNDVNLEVRCGWNEEDQIMEVGTLLDKGHTCNACGANTTLVAHTGERFSAGSEDEIKAFVLGIEYHNTGLVCSPINNNSVDVYEGDNPESKEEII